ncbi:RNA-binding protein [Mesobacillus maritimus]|uniref:YlmH family RNA-binding protein n=1 Tax=Mesobacillus maritimus TaxID=1643336 RepID=UPI002041AFAF|nr:RNA-binding protein [Mesobacillus maritimus]MCM3587111.1 RNA-binding protein [Mesobacillus maritimus]MCM3667676.1 RNA-binding protein [Mesobacillus maritimus]
MNIYQHFRPEEREFIDQVLSWRDYVEQTYAPKLTDFLDPREQQIVQTIIGNKDVKCSFFGGFEGAERQRALLYPDYFEVSEEEFQLCLFDLNYAKKFVSIEHRQVLGSLMSLGLKRGKFGDIVINSHQVQFYAASEISDYVRLQLDSVGKAGISLKEIPLNQAIQPEVNWRELTTTASSLRLDTLMSALYNISRQKSQTYIQHGVVKVNWTTIENPAFECGEGDILSVRGLGRAKIVTIEGKTKKDKYRVIAGRQK